MSMRTGVTVCVAAAILVGAIASEAIAQETAGRLEGRTIDAHGEPVQDVNVIVRGPALQGPRGARSTAHGTFVMLELPVGEYTLTLSRMGYYDRIIEGVRVRLGQTTSFGDLRLEERVYTQEEVAVAGRAPLIDPASTEIGGTVGARDFEALPIDRDYRNIATLLPHANVSHRGDGVNFAGSTGLENRFFVDGIDLTDTNRGAFGTILPSNFIQEVQVRTGGYEAEYRGSLGGAVNAVSYSGGNQVTGQVYGFFLNDQFTSAPRLRPSAPPQGGFTRHDFGFGFGGPIMMERLWYYLAYDPTFAREDIELPGFGIFEDRSTTHSLAAKLTWRAHPRHTLVLTTLGDPTERDAVEAGGPVAALNPDPFLKRLRSGGVAVLVEGRHLVRDNLVMKTSLSHTTQVESRQPATARGAADTFFVDHDTGTVSGGVYEKVDNTSATTAVAWSGTWLSGDHELKAGLEYRASRFDFDQQALSLDRTDTVFVINGVVGSGRVSTRLPSVFLQDSWRLSGRLRLNAGVRWDGQYLISSSGKVAQTILDQWQPRIGFTFQPGTPGMHQVTGSFGRFYHDIPTWPLFWYFNDNTRYAQILFDHDPRADPTGGIPFGAISETQPRIDGMKGQCFDEFTLGYERKRGVSGKAGLRGVYRTLRQGLEDSRVSATGQFQFGNPGSGALSDFPKVKREYAALELAYQGETGERMMVLASYVLSRTTGNYPGLFDSDHNAPFPNSNGSFDIPEILTNGDGLLPNDRTHVAKLSGRYRMGRGFTAGAIGTWQSGTPLSEFALAPDPLYLLFLSQRGSAGRTPSIWDLSLRLAYAPTLADGHRWRPRLTLDLLHVASRRTPLDYDQLRYFSVDGSGNPSDPNPGFGQPVQFQPPMAVRVGAEVAF